MHRLSEREVTARLAERFRREDLAALLGLPAGSRRFVPGFYRAVARALKRHESILNYLLDGAASG